MPRKNLLCALILGCVLAAPAVGQSTITCGPLDDGRIAEVFYKGTSIFFDPVVRYQYESATLTISGPCEDIVKTFKPGEEIFFDLAEVERVLDGSYQWELRFMPAVDPRVREDLQASRGTGEEDDLWWSLWQKGAIPAGPSRDTASFSVAGGSIVDPASGEEGGKSAVLSGKAAVASTVPAVAGVEAAASAASTGAAASQGGGNPLATKDFVINDDLIVIGSTCVGFDCVNGETFGFDTIRLKENNLRIQFDDTSGGSFPTNNWQIRANSNANGGQSFLGFVDQGTSGNAETGTLVFAVEAGAGADALRVDNAGRVGLGTGNPVLELHIADGDTPALRLDQNTSSGFAAQVWDVAGNETSFFVRDATNGSTLPFRIRPGAASNSLVIDQESDVGVGTLSASAPLHVRRSDGSAKVLVEEAASAEAARELAQFQNNGTVTYRFTDTQGTGGVGDDFNWIAGLRTNNQFIITLLGTIGSPLWQMDSSGNVTATSFNPTSSRTVKEDFSSVEPRQVLERVLSLPINEWSYTGDVSEARHLGPVAEDFRRAFQLGADDRHISLTDLGGVSLAAIQGLHQMVQERDVRIQELEERLIRLEAALDEAE